MTDSKTPSAQKAPQTNAAEFTVSEISGSLKRMVEDTFGHVRVRGEISGYRGPHSSGHSYFSLKDDRAKIDAIIWRGVSGRLKHMPEEGLEVIATGKLTTYPGKSSYQIVIDNLEPAGAGALMALLEERKRKLAAEDLFAEERKQLLPFIPRKIGVVTSPTGAVIRDVLHRLNDRFALPVAIWPVRVQGDTCGDEVANAIKGFNAMPKTGSMARPDLIIVARGGGSLEDLWGFNDEAVVRAAADSDIPLISAVGHETDWTLIDYAADVRAPTPTGAAEMAVPVKADLQATISDLGARLAGAISRRLDRERQHLISLSRAVASPERVLEIPRQRLDQASMRHGRGLLSAVERKRSAFAVKATRLNIQPVADRITVGRRELSRFWQSASRDLTLSLAQNRQQIDQIGQRKARALQTATDRKRGDFSVYTARLTVEPIAGRLQAGTKEVHRLANALSRVAVSRVVQAGDRLQGLDRLLQGLSYKATLDRGFAVIKDAKGKTVTRATAAKQGQQLNIVWQDGEAQAVIAAKSAVDHSKQVARKLDETPSRKDQGSLF